MRFLKNERGYTMLFTITLIILFTILGVSLLTLTSNGLTRNEVRQSTSQSNDLAEKGITYFTETLNKELEVKMATISTSSQVDSIFKDFGNKYGCSGLTSSDHTPGEISAITADKTIKSESETGVFNTCISKIEKTLNPYSRLVTYKSTGTANGTEKTHKTQVELGYKYIPGVLNYAVSTNKGGNLYLFGGSEIVGNVKVAGKMFVRDKAFWSSTGAPKWVQSVYPRIVSVDPSKSANIYLNEKKIYKFSDDIKTSVIPSNYITKTNPPSIAQYVDQTNIHQGLLIKSGDTAPTLQQGKFDNLALNIKEKVDAVSKKAPGEYQNTKIGKYANHFNGENGQTGAFKTGYSVDDGSALYIEKNMRIGKYSTNGNGSNDSSKYANFNLNGNYFVNGNVVISGANLKGNAVLYVKGSVDIEFSTINEQDPSNTLFIFAEGPIEIHNISVNSNPGKGSIINGFFYSNSNFLMYGVGSNTTITGGVSAVNTTFTALRGHSVDRLKENQLSASDLTSTDPTPYNACTDNDPVSDGREGNYEYLFEMVDTAKTKEWLEALKKAGENVKLENKKNGKNLSDEELNNLIKLLNNPKGGNIERTVTYNDLEKYLYTKYRGEWVLTKIDRDDLRNKIKVKEIHISDTLLDDLNHLVLNWHEIKNINNFQYVTGYSWGGWLNTRTFSASTEEFNQIQTTMTLLYNVLSELYGDGSSVSSDKCAKWREEINTGKNTSTPTSHNSGGLNYPSRITIVYDEDLITRYLDTNEIQLENTEINVLPGTVRNIELD